MTEAKDMEGPVWGAVDSICVPEPSTLCGGLGEVPDLEGRLEHARWRREITRVCKGLEQESLRVFGWRGGGWLRWPGTVLLQGTTGTLGRAVPSCVSHTFRTLSTLAPGSQMPVAPSSHCNNPRECPTYL